jgi:hypothetical protein
MLVGYSIKLVMVLCLYWYMRRENGRRDRVAGVSLQAGGEGTTNTMGAEEREAVELGMRDATEIDNKGFRYIL